MTTIRSRMGLVGLGVMGRNLALNIAEHGFPVLGLDTDPEKAAALRREGEGMPVATAADARALAAGLEAPRAVLLLVPAGPAVDAAIAELAPHLTPGDLVVDAGNSHFADTDRRAKTLAERGLSFIGMGISGGEAGARRGPSLMPGGAREAFDRIAPVLCAIAARVGDEPCVAHLGRGAAGHYVKMVHNGIEYAVMQLLAECYDLLRRGLGLGAAELAATFERWNRTDLASYLVEITAAIFAEKDPRTGKPLVDVIADTARQKGTGKWTVQDALDLHVPIPTIEAAVTARDLSRAAELRRRAATVLAGPASTTAIDATVVEGAYRAAMLLAYDQGLALLAEASSARGYGIELAAVARVWRGGCIIRAAILDDIARALGADSTQSRLALVPRFAETLRASQGALRAAVAAAASAGIPAPALMASLAYYDGLRAARLPTNLTQAQRDFFGAHTYERTDGPGSFHTHWGEKR